MRTKPPCYECANRTPVCHGQCEAYRVWKAEVDRARERRHITADADAHAKKTIENNYRRMNGRRKVGQL